MKVRELRKGGGPRGGGGSTGFLREGRRIERIIVVLNQGEMLILLNFRGGEAKGEKEEVLDWEKKRGKSGFSGADGSLCCRF